MLLAEERDAWLVEPQCCDAAGAIPDEQHGGALAPCQALWYMPHALDDEQWGMDQNGSVVYMQAAIRTRQQQRASVRDINGVSQPDRFHVPTPLHSICVANPLSNAPLAQGDDVAVEELQPAIIHADTAEFGDQRVAKCLWCLDKNHLDDGLPLQKW